MSKKKAAGKAGQHVSPAGKRLGTKVSDGEKVKTGSILVRQIGSKIAVGKNVQRGRDFTLFAIKSGVVKFGNRLGKKVVSVIEK